jgi:hypothetical protein
MLAGLRLGYVAVVASLAILTSVVGTRASTVVTWDFSTTHITKGNAVRGAFDIAEFYFPEFTANSLTSISGLGSYENQSKPDRVFSMSVLLNGDWVEIYNSGKVPGISVLVPLSTLEMPMLFEAGVISGLKLATLGDVSFAYHNMSGTKFTFDLVATPLPAALPLFGGGLGVLGLARWWRRRSLARSAVD